MLLCDLMLKCRELFVNPLLWTSHHFNLLGCRFVENVDNTSIESAHDKGKTEDNQSPCAEPPSDAELLATKPLADVKRRCLVDILVGEGRAFDKYCKGSEFFFASKPVHRPRYTVFYRHGQPNEHVDGRAPPLVGYLHYGHVKGGRMEMFEACPDPRGRLNRIGAEIGKKRLAQITPGKWTEDPYFSRLLVTNMTDHEYIHLYDTEITAELLRALTQPKSATTYIEFPVILRRKLSSNTSSNSSLQRRLLDNG
ncbi:hypothetical protein BDV12DRAFT_210251 [Aspergillus spectabilis]